MRTQRDSLTLAHINNVLIAFAHLRLRVVAVDFGIEQGSNTFPRNDTLTTRRWRYILVDELQQMIVPVSALAS